MKIKITSLQKEDPSVSIDFKRIEDFQFSIDPTQISRVMINLIQNAVESIESGNENGIGQITIEMRKEGEEAVIEVLDNGPGIPEKLKTRLFNPFVTDQKANGTGLGLAISKQFVESHGGTIELKNVVQGASFKIKLPLS